MQPAARRWLVVALAAGAALRIVPIWFGLPYPQARPDEETALAKALAVASGDLNPRFFHWPSLTFYLFGAVTWLAGAIHGLVAGPRPFTFTEHVLLARGVVALAGTLTIAALFWMARSETGDRRALLAAAFLAGAVLHVRESHFAMTDVLMTLWVVLSLGCLVRAARADRERAVLRWSAVGGIAAGLAVSTKYNAGALVVSMLAVQAMLTTHGTWRWRVRSGLPTVVFAAASLSAFVAGTPFAVLDHQRFVSDLRFDLDHLSRAHNGIDLGRGWLYHVTYTLPYGMGVPAFVAGALGLIPLSLRYRRLAGVTLGFAGAYYLAIGSGSTVFFRYALPLVPVLCLAAAVLVMDAAEWGSRRSAISRHVAVGLLTTLTLGPSLVQSAWLDTVLARTDTRVLAGAWLEPHLGPDTTVHDAGSSYTRLNIWRRPFERWEYDEETGRFENGAGLPVWLVLYDSPLKAYARTPEALRRLADEHYVLVRSWIPVAVDGRRVVYDQQDAFFLPMSGFAQVERPGPTIHLYRRR